MKLDKTSGYILGIVGIVALVGIVVMIMNNAGDFSNDISGQATATARATSTPKIMSSSSSGEAADLFDFWANDVESGTTCAQFCYSKGYSYCALLQLSYSDGTHRFYGCNTDVQNEQTNTLATSHSCWCAKI